MSTRVFFRFRTIVHPSSYNYEPNTNPTQVSPAMSFARSSSPPPPMPSPQLVPTSLPSPPPLSARSFRTHSLHHSSPPSPSSSITQKTISACRSHDRLDRRAKAGLFGDDDDFGTGKPFPYRRLTSLSPSSPRSLKRILAHPSPRCRSPPPSPAVASPPPPVPPIPSCLLASTDKKSVLQPLTQSTALQGVFDAPEHTPHCSRSRCESTPNAMTCMQFFAIHNSSRRDCRD